MNVMQLIRAGYASGGASIPANALRDRAGNLILDRAASTILTRA